MKKTISVRVSSLARILALFVISLGSMITVQAQQVVTFTINGRTAAINGAGYTAHTDYTFNLTLSPEGVFTNHSENGFDSSSNNWNEVGGTTPALYGALTGPLNGTYTGPDTGSNAALYTYFSGQVGLNILFKENELRGPDNSTPLNSISMSLEGISFATDSGSYPETYTDPVIYFGEHEGSYTPSDGSFLTVAWNNGGATMDFTVTSFTVSVSTLPPPAAVPEPSTYAALAGAGALGFSWWRRRRRSAAAGVGN